MKFETLDRGQSERRGRYRIRTREYIYEVTGPKSQPIISAHWHPLARNSRFAEFIRLMIEELGVTPRSNDWDKRLTQTHKVFTKYKTW